MSRLLSAAMAACLLLSTVPNFASAGALSQMKDYTEQENTWQKRTTSKKRAVQVKEAADLFRGKIEAIVRASDSGVRSALSDAVANEIVDASPFEYNCALDVIVEVMAKGDLEKERLQALVDTVIVNWNSGAFWRGTKKVLVVGGIFISATALGGGIAAKIANKVLHGQGTGGMGAAIMMMLGGAVVADVVIGIPVAKFYFYKAFRRNPELVLNPEKAERLLKAAQLKGFTVEIKDLTPSTDEVDDSEINDDDIRNMN